MPFNIAISGVRAAQTDLNVIGNNIANASTTGFKSSRAEFQDVYAASNIGGSGNTPGAGVNSSRIAQEFTQGNVSFTNNGMDLAINGTGFFMVSDNGTELYARDGSFGLDRDGFIVNSNRQKLLAYATDVSGNPTGALGPLQISMADTAPSATTNVDLGVNLDSSSPTLVPASFDPTDASTYTNTTATTVYDSLGGSHTLQIYFLKSGTNTWNLYNYVDGAAVGAANAMTFSSSGTLATPLGGTFTLPAFTPSGGGAAMNVTLDVGSATQFGATFGVNKITQDGFTSGHVSGIDIDRDGVIFARYTNGQSSAQGEIALANFANPQALQPLGKNNWAATFAAGEVVRGTPGSSNLGLIQSGALEESNVDLPDQLVKLIIAQRNFQANTQVIQTANAVTQSVINIR
ncbi:MAG: flagellar hook protein FlgE [Gammaproteobacteria bacterium]|nr:flagellar hook protein FlgE [Gammaproteobacteria bacterium]MBI5615807.1 flagellar hook protein FlgE [Gammaproteobacteria bacterium]